MPCRTPCRAFLVKKNPRKYFLRKVAAVNQSSANLPGVPQQKVHGHHHSPAEPEKEIVEFWNKYQHGPAVPEEMEENWSEDDEMFVFRKVIPD